MSNRLLTFCFILSAILHLILLKGIPFSSPKFKMELPIEVELKFLPPTPAVAKTHPLPSATKKKSVRHKTRQTLKPRLKSRPKLKSRLKLKLRPRPKLKLRLKSEPKSRPKPKPQIKPTSHFQPKLKQPEPKQEKQLESPLKPIPKSEAMVKATSEQSPSRIQSANATVARGHYSPKKGIPLDYLKKICLLIEQNKEYPFLARRQGIAGKVTVVFSLKRDGHLGAIKIEKSSGYALLDKAAIKAIKKAAPFPPFPPEFIEEKIILKLPVCFKLR